MRRIQSFASSVNLIVEWSARCQHEWRESFPQLSIKIHFELKTFPNVSPPPPPLIKLHWNLKKINLFSHIECSPLGCSRLKWTLQTRSHYSRKLRKNSNYLHPTHLVFYALKSFSANEIFFRVFPMRNVNNKQRDGWWVMSMMDLKIDLMNVHNMKWVCSYEVVTCSSFRISHLNELHIWKVQLNVQLFEMETNKNPSG